MDTRESVIPIYIFQNKRYNQANYNVKYPKLIFDIKFKSKIGFETKNVKQNTNLW